MPQPQPVQNGLTPQQTVALHAAAASRAAQEQAQRAAAAGKRPADSAAPNAAAKRVKKEDDALNDVLAVGCYFCLCVSTCA